LIFEFLSEREATLVALLCEWFCETNFDFRFRSMVWYSKDRSVYIYLKRFKVSRCSVLEFQILKPNFWNWFTDLVLIFNSWIENMTSSTILRFEHFQIKVNFSKLNFLKGIRYLIKNISLVCMFKVWNNMVFYKLKLFC
jgi:hypothetical protein